jgi:polyferredoxin
MAAQPGAIKRKPRGLAAAMSVQNMRLVVQAGFFAFIAMLVVRHSLVPEGGGAAVPSPEAYCPFGGIETLYRTVTAAATGGTLQFINHAKLSNVVVLVALLISAVLLKSSFCGWICPFGTLQEWIMGFSRFVQRKVPALGRLVKRVRSRPSPFLSALDRWLRWLKYGVLGLILYYTIAAGKMVFRDYDPYAALISLPSGIIWPAFAILIAVIVLGFFVERPWCRYLCPLSPVIGLFGKLAPVKIERTGTFCKGCNICEVKCPVGLPVASATRITAVECNNCLKCIEVCPRGGALDLRLRWPWSRGPMPALVVNMRAADAAAK